MTMLLLGTAIGIAFTTVAFVTSDKPNKDR